MTSFQIKGIRSVVKHTSRSKASRNLKHPGIKWDIELDTMLVY